MRPGDSARPGGPWGGCCEASFGCQGNGLSSKDTRLHLCDGALDHWHFRGSSRLNSYRTWSAFQSGEYGVPEATSLITRSPVILRNRSPRLRSPLSIYKWCQPHFRIYWKNECLNVHKNTNHNRSVYVFKVDDICIPSLLKELVRTTI